jgi:2,3-bisphosphoglycerate-dependent phosphoglycerate mutase
VERTRVVLIRHGESVAMVDRFVSGHDTCRGLSDLGHQQANMLRDRLLRTGELRGASVMYTSILPRAIETAAAIAPAVGDGLAASEHCEWCEQHPGEGEGLDWDEYDSRYGVFNEGDDRERVRAPGSESVAVFVRRVEDALLRVVDDHEGETIVIVCHGGVINCAIEVLAGIPFGSLTRYVDNTSLTELERDSDGDKWWLVRLNDAAHLA